MNTFWAVVVVVAVAVVLAGLGFAWLLHRANRVGGSDHDFGMRG